MPDVRKVHTMMERPIQAPTGWSVLNSKTPIPGSQFAGKQARWMGDDMEGVFYSAIRPGDAATMNAAASLGAIELVFVTGDDIERWGRHYCREHGVDYDSLEWIDVLDAYFINHNTGG